MHTRSTIKRMEELRSWIRKNKNASRKQFIAETGGTVGQYYKARQVTGVAKKSPKVSEAMKKNAINRKKQLAGITIQPEQLVLKEVDNTPVKEEVIAEGVTPDFIWYEMELVQNHLRSLIGRVAHVAKVSQTRDAEYKKMMRDLITENTELRVNNSSLKQQVTELTEMINGTPV
jgi:hypothetical protein